MGKNNNYINIVNDIVQGADIYKRYLVGKTFMYVFDNRYIEVMFKKSGFAHLTGVERTISADDFYKEAIRGTLSASQIYFSSRHPKKLCLKKVAQLQNIYKTISVDKGNGYILENIAADKTTFKFGFTELNFTLCFGEDYNNSGIKKSDFYIAQSLRDENCFNRSQNVYEIDFIFEKVNTCKVYSKLVYKNKNAKELTKSIIKKIDNHLIKELSESNKLILD
ncbi:PBECR4 domain-containing protein [Dielma fastidiosa]|uniref:PBECR4 domain-containing protein n=1 Tax=Dielma fastidiosa TaxID=1034346 RepID=UPI000E487D6B|nr:PBECR4 domain-containing protein [Dielma fastidiosa]RHM97836.1 hypothetical protein DWZ33_14865 [Dielma fastidiosa]